MIVSGDSGLRMRGEDAPAAGVPVLPVFFPVFFPVVFPVIFPQ